MYRALPFLLFLSFFNLKAATPTVPSSGLTTSLSGCTGKKFTWTAGDGSFRMIVLNKTGPVDILPVDGTTYYTNNYINNGSGNVNNIVYYQGAASSVTINGLAWGTKYWVAIIEYSGNKEYLTSSYLKDSFISTKSPAPDFTFSYKDSCSRTNEVVFKNTSSCDFTNPKYVWKFYDESTYTYNDDSGVFHYSYTMGGLVKAGLVLVSSNECTYVIETSKTMLIYARAIPHPQFLSDSVFCYNHGRNKFKFFDNVYLPPVAKTAYSRNWYWHQSVISQLPVDTFHPFYADKGRLKIITTSYYDMKPKCYDSAFLSYDILPDPKPNLGPDLYTDTTGTIALTPGKFEYYVWSTKSTKDSIWIDCKTLQPKNNKYWVTVTDSMGCSSADTIYISTIYSLYSRNIQRGNISVFPQPAGDILNIKSAEHGEITTIIYDMNGRKISEGILQEFGTLNTRNLQNGNYLLSVLQNHNRYDFLIQVVQ